MKQSDLVYTGDLLKREEKAVAEKIIIANAEKAEERKNEEENEEDNSSEESEDTKAKNTIINAKQKEFELNEKRDKKEEKLRK